MSGWILMGMMVALFALIWFGSYLSDKKREREGVQIEMIRARIMLLSTSTQEIEEFLMVKEPYINKEMINQLINRIAELKADEAIDKSWGRRLTDIKPGTLPPLPEDEIVEVKYTEKA